MPANFIAPFQIENAGIRGRVLRLDQAVDEIIRQHNYPEPVSMLVGEAVCLAALLGSSLKFDGTFTLQTKGDGPVKLMVADFRSPGHLRGYAQFDADALEDCGDVGPMALLGEGHLALTIDQGEDMQRYQSIVALEGETLTDCTRGYFRDSVQIPTAINLGIDRPYHGAWRAGAIMVQNLPSAGLANIQDAPGRADAEIRDTWRRVRMMLSSATEQEFTDPELPSEDLLFRLFHEDGVRIFRKVPLEMKCRCSRERIFEVLHSFEPEEMADMIVDGKITVTCEFCNSTHEFDPKLLAH